jgi:hypothetical protein
MHEDRLLQQWAVMLRGSRDPKDKSLDKALIMGITETTLPKAWLDKLGLKWSTQPCNSRSVRLSYPQLPHGAHPGNLQSCRYEDHTTGIAEFLPLSVISQIAISTEKVPTA